MSKSNATETAPLILDLKYDLHALPTAQHKAGLAGLLLHIGTLRMRGIQPHPSFELNDRDEVTVSLTAETLQTLFDDLYDAELVETDAPKPYAGKEPKRVDEREVVVNGKAKKEKRYVYDTVQPKGEFLRALFPPGADVYLKLWRDMLWGTFRAIPQTRNVYGDRAEGLPTREGERTWNALVKARAIRPPLRPFTESVASSLFVGAQDVNAERVPFVGQPEHNFLLHFWSVASFIFTPRLVAADGSLEDAGYVLAIPEPLDLQEFIFECEDLLRSLDTTVSGYRPRSALIHLPAEGGLEYLYWLAHRRIQRKPIAEVLHAVEVYHLEKRGNNVKMHTAQRVLPDPRVLDEYERLRESARNPMYKVQRLRNLLDDLPWQAGFDGLFAGHPWEMFVWSAATPRSLPYFGMDVRRKFDAIEEEWKLNKGGNSMAEGTADDHLAHCVYGLVQSYVNRRTEDKSGLRYASFKEARDDQGRVRYPEAYRDAREKVCSDAFLAMRGRRDKDFVEYFAGTICSVPQWLPEADFVAVSQALMTRWEDVKTLSMLALSACAWFGQATEVANNTGKGDEA